MACLGVGNTLSKFYNDYVTKSNKNVTYEEFIEKILEDFIERCRKNDYDSLTKLIKLYDINSQTLFDNETILHLVCQYDKKGEGVEFIKKNFRPSQVVKMCKNTHECGNTVFHSSAHNCNNIKMLKFLFKIYGKKDFMQMKNAFGMTPYEIAEKKGGMKWCKKILKFIDN